MSDYTEGFPDVGRKKDRISRFNAAALIGIPLAAIVFQVSVPRFISYLSYLESAAAGDGLFFGDASIASGWSPVRRLHRPGAGFAFARPIGMFGIVKTLVGYFAASVSQRFDVENSMVRLVLGFFFYFFHQFFYWVLKRALLGQTVDFDLERTLVVAVLNALVAVPLFRTLDRLKVTG